MLKPRALQAGDRIAVVAPASSFKREEFDAGVRELERLGFIPVYDETVFARHASGFVAGAPEVRAAAIHRAWRDPSIAGVIGVRGGYGSAQLLPLLDVAEARRACKPLIGYSDLTALLTFLTMTCDLGAFHGPLIDRMARGEDGYDRDTFERALLRPEPLGELAPDAVDSIHDGEAEGRLFGGNLTQLVASLGTPYAFQPPHGYVLFFEDVGERPYRLDRMVTQLSQAGILTRAAGIVIGQLTGCDEPDGSPTANDTMRLLFRDFPGPVIAGFPSGHVTGASMTLPLGVMCRVIARGRPRLVFEEAAVEARS